MSLEFVPLDTSDANFQKELGELEQKYKFYNLINLIQTESKEFLFFILQEETTFSYFRTQRKSEKREATQVWDSIWNVERTKEQHQKIQELCRQQEISEDWSFLCLNSSPLVCSFLNPNLTTDDDYIKLGRILYDFLDENVVDYMTLLFLKDKENFLRNQWKKDEIAIIAIPIFSKNVEFINEVAEVALKQVSLSRTWYPFLSTSNWNQNWERRPNIEMLKHISTESYFKNLDTIWEAPNGAVQLVYILSSLKIDSSVLADLCIRLDGLIGTSELESCCKKIIEHPSFEKKVLIPLLTHPDESVRKIARSWKD